MDAALAITTKELSCGYGGRAILREVEIALPQGGISCILGPSGCGKSTLLRTLILLEKPIAGDIFYEGDSLAAMDGARRKALLHHFGVLFQGAALFNDLSLLDNAAFPLVEVGGLTPERAREVAIVKLDLVGLGAHARFRPAQVSGGMRKRCGIARALALDPPCLFLDEPGAGLDPITAAELDAMIISLREDLGTTMVVVTHELESIRRISDHLVMLGDGRVLCQGSLEEMDVSTLPTVRAFFDGVPRETSSVSSGPLSRHLEAGTVQRDGNLGS